MSPGRPSLYTEELAARICERLRAGETLRAICRDEDMPAPSTVLLWVGDPDRKAFSEQYTRDRAAGYSHMADELLEIADDKSKDAFVDSDGTVHVNSEVVARSRLRVDTRKWLLSKALPKVYGDKIAHVGGDENDSPMKIITRIELVSLRGNS